MTTTPTTPSVTASRSIQVRREFEVRDPNGYILVFGYDVDIDLDMGSGAG